MREIVHIQAGQCGNQIGAKVSHVFFGNFLFRWGVFGNYVAAEILEISNFTGGEFWKISQNLDPKNRAISLHNF
jgi:hypothetical protein